MKAVLVIDIDEKYIDSFGTEIQFINQKYNCKWELKPMPEKNTWGITKNGHVTEYAEGWNDCLAEITGETE